MNIAVFNTGGTISCIGNPLGPMSAQDFTSACTNLLNPILLLQYPNLNLTYIQPTQGDPSTGWFPESSSGTLDSTNLQPTDWCIIAQYILNNYNKYDGWVILHGTDSMDFTGTALPFLLSSFNEKGIAIASLSKPIVLTGSQVPLFYQASTSAVLSINFNTDAFQNFCGSIAAAQSGIPEVCIYFQNKLFRGNRTIKTNASKFDAFSSPNYSTLAEFGIDLSVNDDNILPPPVSYEVSLDNPTVLLNRIKQLQYIALEINNFPIMQFNAFPAWYNYTNYTGIISQLIDACVSCGIKGLILESYGEGNFPSGCPDTPQNGAAYQALNNANNKGVIIVDCTQVLTGIVKDSAYAAGAWLPNVGALSPADMTPMAAFAKLMVLLTSAGYGSNNWTNAQIKYLLQLNLLGEMMNINRLDSRTNGMLLPSQTLTSLDGSCVLTNDPVLGPVFKNESRVLWIALSTPPAAADMPGRLVMQNDGNLVFYSIYNRPLWATNTGIDSGAFSALTIYGSFNTNDLSLQVFDYSHNKVTIILYQ